MGRPIIYEIWYSVPIQWLPIPIVSLSREKERQFGYAPRLPPVAEATLEVMELSSWPVR